MKKMIKSWKNNPICLLLVNILYLLVATSGHGADLSSATGKIFGGRGGYAHPYITVAALYEDNVYQTDDDIISDTAVVVSPGIWVALPRTRKKVVNVNTSTMTPGGLGMVREQPKKFRRFQSYLHYGADLTRYASESANDTDDQRLEGFFQYNFKGGLSLALLDLYRDGHEGHADGISRDIDEYKSNLLGGRAMYALSPKFKLQGDYKYFTLDYDSHDNAYRDRDDQSGSAYLFYRYSSKTTFFTEYDFVDIAYDNDASLDSEEHHFYGGMRWQITGKTAGEVKVGYLVKQFDDPLFGDTDDVIIQLWGDYRVSGKGRIKIGLARMSEEPDIYSRQSVLANSVDLTYFHKLNGKMRLSARLGYELKSYDGLSTYQDSQARDREDDAYQAGLGYEYWIQRWLNVRADYQYFKQDSDISAFSYTDNRFLLRCTLTL